MIPKQHKQSKCQPPSESAWRNRKDKQSVDLRRQRRLQEHSKRRSLMTGAPLLPVASPGEVIIIPYIDASLLAYEPALGTTSHEIDRLKLLQQVLAGSPPPEIAFHTMEALRMILSTESHQPVGVFVALHIVESLLNYLQPEVPRNIVKEACWSLSNIAASTHEYAAELLTHGVPQRLLNLLDSTALDSSEHALCCLANLAGDGHAFRQELMKLGLLARVQSFTQTVAEPPLSLMRTLAWLYSNVARDTDYLTEAELLHVLDALQELLRQADSEVQAECLWGLSHLTKLEDHKIELIVKRDLGKYAIAGLASEDAHTRAGSVRLLGNIASGTAEHTQYCLSLGVLNELEQFFHDNDPTIRKEVYWLLSNVAAGTLSQVIFLLSHDLFPEAVKGVLDQNLEARCEAGYIWLNLLKVAGDEHWMKLELLQYLPTLATGFITEAHPEYLAIVLEVCGLLLQVDSGDVRQAFESSGLQAAVEATVKHLNSEISGLALSLVEEYFDRPADTEMAPVEGPFNIS